jgi:hypothetical protein
LLDGVHDDAAGRLRREGRVVGECHDRCTVVTRMIIRRAELV